MTSPTNPTFPPFTEAPSTALEFGPEGPIGYVSPTLLCLQSDAQGVMEAIAPLYKGQTLTLVDNDPSGLYYVLYPATELRRQWGINANGVLLIQYAASLIAAQNAYGVGHPGSWQMVPYVGADAVYPPRLMWVPSGPGFTPGEATAPLLTTLDAVNALVAKYNAQSAVTQKIQVVPQEAA